MTLVKRNMAALPFGRPQRWVHVELHEALAVRDDVELAWTQQPALRLRVACNGSMEAGGQRHLAATSVIIAIS